MFSGGFKRFDRRIIERIAADDENLEKVKMNGKRVDDDRLTRLSEVLSHNTSITSLHLSNNSIGHDGIVALADALHQNLHVEYIDLSGNNIGNKGAAALADCLQHNNISLISLDLQNNGIEDEGAAALLSAVSTNSTIHSIDLKGNAIQSSLLSKIDEALNRSKALFEAEVVYFAPSPAKKDHDLAAVDTFSMTLSEESKGDNHSFDSSTEDDICVEVSNDYVFQGAPITSQNAELSSPSSLNAEGMAINWMNMIGSFFHNDEDNKDAIEDSKELKVIPVSDDDCYKEFRAFLRNESVSLTEEDRDLIVAEALSTTLSQSGSISHSVSDNYKVLGVQQLSEETEQKNPIGATFDWIGSLFHNEEEKNDTGAEEVKERRKVPVSDDEGFQEFLAILKT
ncbi:leucine-rich repeat protein [Skeletonema marinoi]|uniref:Leucine-rich repeat protein n=1 Tax=Skeletonema marinoi TaxID=267567 RepID=A0AAD9D6H3_9STRA|nr:leucine-rich repeat protein [Skeletonema marinoi]